LVPPNSHVLSIPCNIPNTEPRFLPAVHLREGLLSPLYLAGLCLLSGYQATSVTIAPITTVTYMGCHVSLTMVAAPTVWTPGNK